MPPSKAFLAFSSYTSYQNTKLLSWTFIAQKHVIQIRYEITWTPLDKISEVFTPKMMQTIAW